MSWWEKNNVEPRITELEKATRSALKALYELQSNNDLKEPRRTEVVGKLDSIHGNLQVTADRIKFLRQTEVGP